MIGNTIDMPRINKVDFILANIPVDLPESIPFLYQVVYYISIVIENT